MPPPEAEQSTSRARARANTTSFADKFWRKGRTDQHAQPVQTQPAQQPLSLEELIHALSPPSVPSLSHARSLASVLAGCSPLPKREILNPILNSLCNGVKSPPSVQAAGYDILSAYCENHEALSLVVADKLSYFSVFLGAATPWGIELWEPRFKALRALTNHGADVSGIENNVIDILQYWIEGAFEGLMKPSSSLDRSETAERERSIDILFKFLNDILTRPENISRITEDKMTSVLHFYASLVDRAIALPEIAKEPTTPNLASSATKPAGLGHRRNMSSLSSSSIPSIISTPPQPPIRHPAEFATTLYMNHLSAHIKTMPPTYLNSILPLLFRALAFCASPLPRLSVILQTRKKNTVEDKITETLTALFSGPYATVCMRILRVHLFPPQTTLEPSLREQPYFQPQTVRTAIMASLGATRTFRNYVRRALSARLARAYISREASIGYSHSGAPVHMELQVDLMEKAWPKEDYTSSSIGTGGNGWDASRLGRVLADSVGAWELDLEDEENGAMDEEEATAVGLTLHKLSNYVLPLKNADGTPFTIPIGNPNDAPTPILRTISSLLSRDHSRALNPLLANILIHVAEHLTDSDTARLPVLMADQQALSPTSPEWLKNWQSLLGNETLVSLSRPLTRKTIMDTLQAVYESVKDMKTYRQPLGDLVWKFCGGSQGHPSEQNDDAPRMWKMMGEEVVLRSAEQAEEGQEEDGTTVPVSKFLDLLFVAAMEKPDEYLEEGAETDSVYTADTHSPTAVPSMSPISPTVTQTHSDMPSVMSILSSLATGTAPSRSQSTVPQLHEESRESREREIPPTPPRLQPPNRITRDVSATSALVEIFCQLTFTPFSLRHENLLLAIKVYEMLLSMVSKGKSNKARLTALQFLVRLRVDRDHKVYFVSGGYDPNGLVGYLGALINRVVGGELSKAVGADKVVEDTIILDPLDIRRTRPRLPQERNGRQASRGRGAGPGMTPRTELSRSRSRAPPPPPPPPKPLEMLWQIPEALAFSVDSADSPGEVLVSYNAEGPDRVLLLPLSHYLQIITSIIEKETNWEVLSYVLCHLPVQLSNKHLFCGPKCRAAISKLLSILCTGIVSGELALSVEQFPPGLKARDAHGLAYQTLSVLISYKRCFDLQQRHLLVEVFNAGLNDQLTTTKCCLHALSLSAFELQPSITKCLSRILEKLSQIMSNPNMAVHILGFLSIIGSLPCLHVNFTEADFKMVFGVALQYLQHYNRKHVSPTMSWALSQHVRILSYSAVYIWFLAVKLPDRPRHIRYITRQLLLANEGNTVVDGPTEVCFDWLARYAYASADPRPANSVFSEIVLNPSTSDGTSEIRDNEKTWIIGNSIVTVRTLPRSGWVEVMSRRPSGFSRFVCRVENVPMVGPGDVSPDLFSIPAGLIMEREPPRPATSVEGELLETDDASLARVQALSDVGDNGDAPPRPDPIKGYVWSKTAPSQRRKHVDIDPSFLLLQLSPLPDGTTEPFIKRVHDSSSIPKFVASLDRIPVIDTHKVGIMYVAPGQTNETDILRNEHGSPAYTRFLEGLGRLINLRGQVDVYAGGLDPDEDGEYAYAWWDDIGQILYHTATMMPTSSDDPLCNNKKRHIGNDYVRIVWNDSGLPYRFDTLKTQFQFVNIVVEPHSLGSIAAFSNNLHENEYFKITIQLAPGMTEFTPIGHFKLISAENLPLLVRQLGLLSDWFASVFRETQMDTVRVEMKTNWHSRLEAIQRFKNQLPHDEPLADSVDGVMGQEALRDFTTSF
ncbi:hypothetical protein CPB84DRAFT_1848328 [Gymnopilus junonius]|uniref:Rap-GAP domain-containing protein n=1 Tax=Gymnopilus junonius TaxID=109634 RepID=A0A9P5NN00_GYMJU|nr:hypothetical protein CPB84DRAFT_1848328 [Gymnopilus junonius]